MRKNVLEASERKRQEKEVWANLAEPHCREWEEFWEVKGSTYFLNTA